MSKLQPAAIKEIVNAINEGNTCFLHRFSAKITVIDNKLEDPVELEKQNKLIAQIEKKIESYIRIDQPTTEDQLVIMQDFLDDVPDKSIRKQLSNALNRGNPVRNFLQVVESDMVLNIHWNRFNFVEQQRWVSNIIIDAYNY